MSALQLSRNDTARVKRPLSADALPSHEVERLVRVFVQGKTAILEEDILPFIQWARGVRWSALLLEMMLDGDISPVVEAGVVKLAVPGWQGEQRVQEAPHGN